MNAELNNQKLKCTRRLAVVAAYPALIVLLVIMTGQLYSIYTAVGFGNMLGAMGDAHIRLYFMVFAWAWMCIVVVTMTAIMCANYYKNWSV